MAEDQSPIMEQIRTIADQAIQARRRKEELRALRENVRRENFARARQTNEDICPIDD